MLSTLLFCRFTAAIDAINMQLEQHAQARQELQFLNCGHLFLEDGNPDWIQPSLMPDGLNLSQEGMQQLASCLDPAVQVTPFA